MSVITNRWWAFGPFQSYCGRQILLTDCPLGIRSPWTIMFFYCCSACTRPKSVGGLGEGLETVSISMLTIFHSWWFIVSNKVFSITQIFIFGQATKWKLHFSDALLLWHYNFFLRSLFHMPLRITSEKQVAKNVLNCGSPLELKY